MGLLENIRKNKERKQREAEVRKKLADQEKKKKVDAAMNSLKAQLTKLETAEKKMAEKIKDLDEYIRNAFKNGNENEVRRKLYSLKATERMQKLYGSVCDIVSQKIDDLEIKMAISDITAGIEVLEGEIQLAMEDVTKLVQWSTTNTSDISLDAITGAMEPSFNTPEITDLFNRYKEECRAEMASENISAANINTPNGTVNTKN